FSSRRRHTRFSRDWSSDVCSSDRTGYVRLQDFNETTNQERTAALERLETAGMRRLLLDLRENPGGPLDQAIAVSNQFLRRGELRSEERRVGTAAQRRRATLATTRD